MQANRPGDSFHLDPTGFAEARDVLGQRAFEQFHALRQIAQVRPEFLLVPGEHIGTIQAHLAADRRPQPHQQPCQRGLAGSRRTDHRQHLAGLQAKSQALEDRRLTARRCGDQILDRQPALGRRQQHGGLPGWQLVEQLIEPDPGVAQVDHRAPLRHDLHQRGQHATTQHRTDDHHARATRQGILQD